MRRNIGRHTNGNTARAIDQQVRILRRQDDRLLLLAIIVILKVVVSQNVVCRLGETTFRITHRRGRIGVDRPEITLTINKWQTHRKRLCHSHERVINRAVTMRVEFTDHITNNTRRLEVWTV